MLSPGFEDLQKAYVKALPVVQKESNGQPPDFFLRCIIECETFVAQLWEDREFRYVQDLSIAYVSPCPRC